mmetsp:Transcript_5032/g.15805  ORF Transcript_5032/g.15805 Transcript_5032/m.15805 type:complete len:225 (-) Transcript_5032:323-997(-)
MRPERDRQRDDGCDVATAPREGRALEQRRLLPRPDVAGLYVVRAARRDGRGGGPDARERGHFRPHALFRKNSRGIVGPPRPRSRHLGPRLPGRQHRPQGAAHLPQRPHRLPQSPRRGRPLRERGRRQAEKRRPRRAPRRPPRHRQLHRLPLPLRPHHLRHRPPRQTPRRPAPRRRPPRPLPRQAAAPLRARHPPQSPRPRQSYDDDARLVHSLLPRVVLFLVSY